MRAVGRLVVAFALVGCFSRAGDAGDVDAGSVDAGPATSDGSRGVLGLIDGMPRELVDDAGAAVLEDASRTLEGGALEDARAVLEDAGRDAGAELVDAGADAGELPGVDDPSKLVEYGTGGYNARFGCLPGYLNCDGMMATGCELYVGCPDSDGKACATCAGGGAVCWCKGATCFTAPNAQACP